MTTQLTLQDHVFRINKSDICSRKHHGNRNSIAATQRVDKQKDRELIFQLIKEATNGLTLKQACALLNRTPNQISGRFSELKKARLIYVSGRRDGCGVYYPVEFVFRPGILPDETKVYF